MKTLKLLLLSLSFIGIIASPSLSSAVNTAFSAPSSSGSSGSGGGW